MDLYPLLFQPNLHTTIWGGHRLTTYKGLPDSSQPIGESWEVSAVEGSESKVSNGPLQGQTITDIIRQAPEQILGKSVAQKYGSRLPLLVKFIDADRDLSIQVHPDDTMAQRVHGKTGKSEMWYVIDAKPGSYLYSGFKDTITPEAYRQHVAGGTITDVLAQHHVKSGDVFYIPAGRVHAIGGGILLAEVQQSSDITYRIYDYNRPGLDGQPRQLHTDLASQALNYEVEKSYKTDYKSNNNQATLIIDSPHFNVRVSNINRTFHRNLLKYDSFVIMMCIQGGCHITLRHTGQEQDVREGHSCLIPAAIADYDITPLSHTARVLDTFINHKDSNIIKKFVRFFTE